MLRNCQYIHVHARYLSVLCDLRILSSVSQSNQPCLCKRYSLPLSHLYMYMYVYLPVQCHCDISGMEQEMKQLQEAAALFEVNVPDFKQLKMCRREIGLLKGLWDMIMIVKSSFEDWNTTLWKDINVENMEMDCKKFVKVSKHHIQ